MPDDYYTLKAFNKRISARLKPRKFPFDLSERIRGLARLRRPRIK